MKRSGFKGFFAGVLTTLLLVSTICMAGATVTNIQKTLEYKDIQVTLDGKKLDLKDAKGNAVEPFMLDGTNYLPVRALSEALGLDVSWDGNTNTVVLKTAEAKQEETPATEKLLYDQDNVKIYYLGITAGSSSLGGSNINLRIENNSSKGVMVQTRDFSVNGFMTDCVFSCEVAAGKKANSDIKLFQSALDENSINDITGVELKFKIINTSDWTDSTQSKTISIDI
ncbi:hypothetical protein OBV_27580 [Oscillibacter valericigenes Sjm18-20]|nr:hypothetical protein OBV_27580 [Oscillibacter valericigenes Sjm18-20]